MHSVKVLILGPNSFVSTLIELKEFLKFNLYDNLYGLDKKQIDFNVVIIHKEVTDDILTKNILVNNNLIKVLATDTIEAQGGFDAILNLPVTLRDVNLCIENIISKNTFNKNSSIKIKNEYLLDKNKKLLINIKKSIALTEKEIQLIELFLANKKPISKNKILSSTWNYSNDADTHTVETHIYRLRKKINDYFGDEKFIMNNKEGYYL